MSEGWKVVEEVRDRIQAAMRDAIKRLREEFRERLPYEAGRVRGGAVGWCRVEFSRAFRDPAVVCTLEEA